MTLGHSTLHCMLWTTWSVWLPDPGHPQERRRQLSLKSCVVGGLLLALPFITSQRVSALSVFSKHLFTCTLSRVLTPVTQFHCSAATAYVIWRWQTMSVHSLRLWLACDAWRYTNLFWSIDWWLMIDDWCCLKWVRRVMIRTFRGISCQRSACL